MYCTFPWDRGTSRILGSGLAQNEGTLSLQNDQILVQTQFVKAISTDFQLLEFRRNKKPQNIPLMVSTGISPHLVLVT